MSQVGVLLPRDVLRRVVQRKSSWERVDLYVAAARKLGLDLMTFSLGDCDLRQRTVRGYVPSSKGWVRTSGPLPTVIHNRVVPLTLGIAYHLRWLEKSLEGGMFNPSLPPDRWEVRELLGRDASIRNHLAPAFPLTLLTCERLPDFVRTAGRAAIRAREPGSAQAAATVFIEPHLTHPRRFRLVSTSGRRRVLGESALVRHARLLCRRRPHVVEAVRADSSREDADNTLRVSVQRGEDGAWRAVASRAEAPATSMQAEWLCESAARCLERFYPTLADVEFHLELDEARKLWIAGVDFRSRRLWEGQAMAPELRARLFETPIAFAKYLITHETGGEMNGARRTDKR